ncbi:methionine biosynthesis protein MetW [Victivallis vadensis]|uniref:methionine biosynthesis protein MetW n=1 Tax=Victivallis vadensis TaxID=172901 RepID=UPI0025931BCE|nr:methionine biosynthesis protein MetW [uncultured Victivallis sp.]
MVESLYLDLKARPDLEVISRLVDPGHRVLDLGCGDGIFLKMLREKRGAEVLGMEISQVEVAKCIANGVPVIQSDLDDDLDFAEDGSFDLVILSQTLQQMRRPDRLLRRLVRVGKRGAVSFINFGHFHCRWQLMLAGSMPRTTQIPYQWYNTPNIHLGTIRDFRRLCKHLGIRIVQEIPIGFSFPLLTAAWPNLFAVGCVFVIERAQ